MSKISSSPERDTFQLDCLKKRLEEGETTQEHVDEMTELYLSWGEQKRQQEQDPEWQKNNLEWDLRITDWIVAKVQASEAYAQNLYAAMCNRDFQKNDVWPQLKKQTWSCSWRYAGGIVADMRGEGDYIDWYCSGIRGGATDSDLEAMTEEQRKQYDYYQTHFVGEGHVTDEVRQDLFRLGWLVVDSEEDDAV